MTEDSHSKIWVFAEQRQGCLADVGLELLRKALELAHPMGWKVAALLLGCQVAGLCEELLSFGVDEILVADHSLLNSYCGQAYAKVVEGSIRQYEPEVFLIGATAMGADLGPRVAANLRTGLSAHCVDLKVSSEGDLSAVVPGWGGNVLATVRCPSTRPQMATVMPGVFEIPQRRSPHGRVIYLRTDLKPDDLTYQILEVRRHQVQENALEKAEVVVAGGWGIGSQADWGWVEALASALNGAVGATRPAVDEGWAKENQMVGQSGRTIHPKLYIGVAISGHMHHMVGIKEPEVMVAINQDPKAPIFELCDIGLVGDFKEIIPPLIESIKTYAG